MTTPGITAPDGSFVLGGRFGQDITEDSAKATMSGGVATAYTNAGEVHKTNVLDPISNLLGAVGDVANQIEQAIVNALKSLAQLMSNVPIVGNVLSDIIQNIANGLNQVFNSANSAVNNLVTVAQGITGNITGSTQSGNAGSVGNAVAILNDTVQSGTQPPQTVIVTSTQSVPIPTGCRTVVMNIFGAAGGGGRGSTSFGSGFPAGGGGIGGWAKDISLPASAMTSTLTCNVGVGGSGGTSDGQAGGTGGTSSVASSSGSVVYAQATGGTGGVTWNIAIPTDPSVFDGTPGTGNGVSQVPGRTGGHGGLYSSGGSTPVATAGANGLNVNGGAAGAPNGGTGGNGIDDTSTLIPGNGGSGGGGGGGPSTGNAGAGGHGGHPAGAGGGGGGFYTLGSNGNGGAGADGEIWLTFVF